jgi:hypothetical protein
MTNRRSKVAGYVAAFLDFVERAGNYLPHPTSLFAGALLVFRLVLTGHEATTDFSTVSPVTAESDIFETDTSEPMSGPPDEPNPSPDEVVEQTESLTVTATPRPPRQERTTPRAPRTRPPVNAGPRPPTSKPQPAPAPREARVPAEAELFYGARIAL